jgi:hypothetical protein
MKKYFVYALFLGGAAFSLSSCNNAELEERVDTLEQRVASLEGNGGSQTNTPVVNAASNQVAEAQEISGPAAKFEFEEAEHDFGTIQEGAVVTHTFKFKNVGEVPLVIQNASASCGCTVPDYSREPVAVGETGEVQVKFNSANKKGVQNPSIRITANTKSPITTVKLKGTVAPKADLSAGPVKQ